MKTCVAVGLATTLSCPLLRFVRLLLASLSQLLGVLSKSLFVCVCARV